MWQKISVWLQYLYFIRFSILLWLFLPIVEYLDWNGTATAFTRGILTLDSQLQIVAAAFFIVSANIVVLVSARVVCVNGVDRFAMAPPDGLKWLLGSGETKNSLIALALSQVGTAISLAYVGYVTILEGSIGDGFWRWASLGIVLAIAFWYLASLFYYWTYSNVGRPKEVGMAARPLIFPPAWFGHLEVCPRPAIARYVENVFRWPTFISYSGYSSERGGRLWELHFFSAIALLGFFLLYLVFFPINSPVPLPGALRFLFVVTVVPAILLFLGTFRSSTHLQSGLPSPWARTAKWVFVTLTIGVVVAWLVFLVRDHVPHEERGMPTLASVLILTTFMAWLLGMLAFFFDRYRTPVLTMGLMMIFLPKFLSSTSLEEHYYPAIQLPGTASVPIAPHPSQVFEDLRKRTAVSGSKEGMPLIVITATGGGIHAAAWTAEVMGDLEERFHDDPMLQAAKYDLHNHILLASTVSGGSVGMIAYLREYTAETPFEFPKDVRARMTNTTNCSSLEAVSWGLEYYDFSNFLFSYLPWPVSGTELQKDELVPAGYDRSWAIERALNHNEKEKACGNDPFHEPAMRDVESLTLSQSADLLLKGKLPAFTLNTTAAETGGRFLLSNYQLPDQKDAHSDMILAESFLHAYSYPGERPDLHHHYADISLATAARLSATFPFVSSASRLPIAFADHAYHFVDGGYFDNDGTASAAEFLYEALPRPSSQNAAKTPILLIEIRDGTDLDAEHDLDEFPQQDGYTYSYPDGKWELPPKKKDLPKPWKATQQLVAPAGALWAAGHTSVTRRNRRELCFLEQDYGDRMRIHHLVFDYQDEPNQPLNWHLTPAQQKRIREEAKLKHITAGMDNAVDWVKRVMQTGLSDIDNAQVCRIANPTKPGEK